MKKELKEVLNKIEHIYDEPIELSKDPRYLIGMSRIYFEYTKGNTKWRDKGNPYINILAYSMDGGNFCQYETVEYQDRLTRDKDFDEIKKWIYKFHKKLIWK